MTNPVEAALPTTGVGARGDIVEFLKQRVTTHVFTIAELNGNDFSDHRYVRVISNGRTYKFDATETGADDGASILRDSADNAFVWVPDVSVATLFDHVGTGTPSGGLGDDGDTYYDADTGDVYLKDSGSWGTAIGNVHGSDGPAGTPGNEYGVILFNDDESPIVDGSYPAARYATATGTFTDFYAEITHGEAGDEIEVTVRVNGTLVHGPVTVAYGTPQSATGLSISVTAGDKVNFETNTTSGTPHGAWAQING